MAQRAATPSVARSARFGALRGTSTDITLPENANNTPLGAAFWGDLLAFNPAHSADSFALINSQGTVFPVAGQKKRTLDNRNSSRPVIIAVRPNPSFVVVDHHAVDAQAFGSPTGDRLLFPFSDRTLI
jgi:hypothetical protein